MKPKKHTIEVRDPLHIFVRLRRTEKPVFDSAPFQRLRHVHQLALSYLVYPGATHKRFEHSLGVMELATRIFNTVTDPDNLTDEVRDVLGADDFDREYWRRALRMAALCHDTGHLPFSHAAEEQLLPPGSDHETITERIIRSSEMAEIWSAMKLQAADIVKLAVEPADIQALTPMEAILNEIITGEVLGADRMDYLLRDSLHTGVAYGRFDHFRLIDTMRVVIAPSPSDGAEDEDAPGDPDPRLGLEEGGKESAEALLLARYFMFSQVYLHRIRRIYDIHLMDFLKEWLDGGRFAIELDKHLAMSDNEVNAAIAEAARDGAMNGHAHAKRIAQRQHFKVLYAPAKSDLERNSAAAKQVYEAAAEKYGPDAVRLDRYRKGSGSRDFPVLRRDGSTAWVSNLSDVIANVPEALSHYVFIDRGLEDRASRWLESVVHKLTEPREEDDDLEEDPK